MSSAISIYCECGCPPYRNYVIGNSKITPIGQLEFCVEERHCIGFMISSQLCETVSYSIETMLFLLLDI